MKHSYGSLALALFFALSYCAGAAGYALAVDDDATVSRDEWRARIVEARRRLELMRRQRKPFSAPLPTPEEIADEQSRRAFEDDSLMPGDIISTRKGLFMFRGSGARGLAWRLPPDLALTSAVPQALGDFGSIA